MLDYQRVSLWHCGYRSLFAGFTNILGLSGWWHGLSGAGTDIGLNSYGGQHFDTSGAD
jgi:hypothetical protein